VAAEAEVIATLFRRRCRAVAMKDRRIETAVLMKPRTEPAKIASMQPSSTQRRQMR
jgi:hypothetical protein